MTTTDLHERAPVGTELLRAEDLVVEYPIRSRALRRRIGTIHAVSGVSLSVRAGETLGIVGESGCGKSTTGLALLRLLDVTSGRIMFKGHDITRMGRRELRPFRREMQIVLQNPSTSLDPRMPVADILAEPLQLNTSMRQAEMRRRVAELLEMVGLRAAHAGRYPHEFSGGQRQRIGIARALALEPQLVVLDEPVSALDVSVQAQVVNLLAELQQRLSLAYVVIAHDLAVVKHLCDRAGVMYLGRMAEIGETSALYGAPQHPYTQALLSSVPISDPDLRGSRERVLLSGDLPDPAHPPSGCRFRTRCFVAQPRCAEEKPGLAPRAGSTDDLVACHYPGSTQAHLARAAVGDDGGGSAEPGT